MPGGLLMRTTLNVDEQLLNKEQQLTGIGGKAALVRKGLRALIERESARRLAANDSRRHLCLDRSPAQREPSACHAAS